MTPQVVCFNSIVAAYQHNDLIVEDLAPLPETFLNDCEIFFSIPERSLDSVVEKKC